MAVMSELVSLLSEPALPYFQACMLDRLYTWELVYT